MKILFALACVGFAISALVHFSTYFGIDPSERFPYVWLMHLGALAIFIPSIVIAFTMLPKDENGAIQTDGLAPKWMQWLTGVAGVLAVGNFALFIIVLLFWGSGAERNGQYVLMDVHNHIVRPINEADYHQYNANGVCFFSSFWLFFYSLGMTVLASAIVCRRLDQTSAFPAKDLDERPTGMPLWIHNLLILAVLAVGLWTGPFIIVATSIVFHLKFGLFATVLFFPAGIAGVLVAIRCANKLP